MSQPPITRPVLVDRRYQLGGCIGQGGMGMVFRGVDTVTGENVAIKWLPPEASQRDSATLQRFQREGQVLARLNHPNIVKLRGAFTEEDNHYLVMDLVSGGSLDRLLGAQSRPLALERVLGIALELSDALARAHGLGIIHRDIKPSNVLIAEDGTPRLSDFGMAQIAGTKRLSGSKAVPGTLDYLCPEALMGRSTDARADLWAFGVLLFEMLSSRRPFAAEHAAATLQGILNAPPLDLEALRPECPTALADLTYRLLAKDSDQRIPSARQVGAELERILASLTANPAGEATRAESRFASPTPISGVQTPNSGAAVRKGLPAPTTPLVGRHAELAALAALLVDPQIRLVTVVGAGGMGKSRLALQAAWLLSKGGAAFEQTATSAPEMEDGVALVELAPLGSVDFIVSAIAEAVGLQFHPGAELKAQLLAYLAPKKLVLVMDNFEHLLEGASLVSDLNEAAPGVKVLATSRERLGSSQEYVFGLSGLSFPGADALERAQDFSGVQLFMQCVRRVKPDFELTSAAAAEMAGICAAVSGMPLAIVLAASWVNLLSLQEIAQEIAGGFGFLESGLRDAPKRQHSIGAVFDHSYRLLDAEQRRVFSSLSVFRGGFTRVAAQAVTGANLRTLAALLNKSLIQRDPANGRYGIHELLRQYADAKLREVAGQYEHAKNLHGRYCSAFLNEREAALDSADPLPATREIEGELDNLRSAWSWLLDQGLLVEVNAAIRAFSAFLMRACLAEAESILRATADALARSAGAPNSEHVGLAGVARGLLAQCHGRLGRPRQWAEHALQALALLDESSHPRDWAQALLEWALAMSKLGGAEKGLPAAEKALSILRATDEPAGLARALTLFGFYYRDQIGPERAEAYFRESLACGGGRGNGGALAMPITLPWLAELLAERGEHAEALRLMLQAGAHAEHHGERWHQARFLHVQARIEYKWGAYADAEAHVREALAVSRDVAPNDTAWDHILLGELLREQGRFDEARAHFRRCLDTDEDENRATVVRLQLGTLAFEAGDYAEARQFLEDSLLRFERLENLRGKVSALDQLGYLACRELHPAAAREAFQRALEGALRSQFPSAVLSVLAGTALLFARLGEPERALELLALVRHHPALERHILVRRVEPLLAELAATLSPAAFALAMERGRGLEFEAVSRSVLESLGGRWSFQKQPETVGKTHIRALANPPCSVGPSALSAREQQVTALAALGRSNKLIAYELGLAHATVRVLIARAARKIGARSRAELITRLAAPSTNGGPP
ncbi:MAG: protein kinase [Deltaproteobacteria bacterium]